LTTTIAILYFQTKDAHQNVISIQSDVNDAGWPGGKCGYFSKLPKAEKKADSCMGCSRACDFGVVRCSKDLGRYGEREYNCICKGGTIAIP